MFSVRMHLEKYMWFQFIIVILLIAKNVNALNALHTLETPIREALLKPRNFNHHPYENHQGYTQHAAINLNAIDTDFDDNSLHNIVSIRGPHEFPRTFSRDQQLNDLQYPYNGLRYNQQSNEHSADFLTNDVEEIPKKQYAFSYTVRDTHSGDDFSHTQQQRNGAVQGTYKVQLPDGRTQVVRYTADNDGYRADVSYLLDKNAANHAEINNPQYYHKHVEPIDEHAVSYDANYDPNNDYQHRSAPPPPPPLSPVIPTASSRVFVSTVRPPPAPIHKSHFNVERLSLEERQTISARPTYVISPKSTKIGQFVPSSGNIDNENLVFHSAHGVYFQ